VSIAQPFQPYNDKYLYKKSLYKVYQKMEEHVCCNCGREAKYQLKNKKWYCEKSTSSCPVIKNKLRQKSLDFLKNPNKIKEKPEILDTGLCSYGCGNPWKFKLKGGKYCCEETWHKCTNVREKMSHSLKQLYREYRPFKEGRAIWNKGLNKQTDERCQKAATTLKGRYERGELKGSFLGRQHTKEAKEKLSIKGSCHNIRCTYYEIFNPNENKMVKVQGSWEFKYAEYLNSKNIKWTHSRKMFLRYKRFEDDFLHTYYPDFYLPDVNEYVEVKGYYSQINKEKMEAVWKTHPDKNITLLFRKDLLSLGLNIK